MVVSSLSQELDSRVRTSAPNQEALLAQFPLAADGCCWLCSIGWTLVNSLSEGQQSFPEVSLSPSPVCAVLSRGNLGWETQGLQGSTTSSSHFRL